MTCSRCSIDAWDARKRTAIKKTRLLARIRQEELVQMILDAKTSEALGYVENLVHQVLGSKVTKGTP